MLFAKGEHFFILDKVEIFEKNFRAKMDRQNSRLKYLLMVHGLNLPLSWFNFRICNFVHLFEKIGVFFSEILKQKRQSWVAF